MYDGYATKIRKGPCQKKLMVSSIQIQINSVPSSKYQVPLVTLQNPEVHRERKSSDLKCSLYF